MTININTIYHPIKLYDKCIKYLVSFIDLNHKWFIPDAKTMHVNKLSHLLYD